MELYRFSAHKLSLQFMTISPKVKPIINSCDAGQPSDHTPRDVPPPGTSSLDKEVFRLGTQKSVRKGPWTPRLPF